MTINLSHARQVLTRSEDSMLQIEMSAVTDGSVMGVSAEMEMETTGHPLILLLRKNKCLSSNISAKNAENHLCRKGTWSATGNNTTNCMMDLVSLAHSVMRNLPCLMIYILIRTVFI